MFYIEVSFFSSFSSLIGKRIAAISDIATVSMIILVPDAMPESKDAYVNIKLAVMEIITSSAMILFCLAGGMMIARNIPYNPTLKALTILAGRAFPRITPRQVPITQPGEATDAIPYV